MLVHEMIIYKREQVKLFPLSDRSSGEEILFVNVTNSICREMLFVCSSFFVLLRDATCM